jgi:mono/diheme cytochrome c family protein
MNAFRKSLLLAAAGIVLIPSALAQAQAQRADFGKREFEANCASCHGVDGKGNGPVVEFLKKSPPDLTLLAKGNNSVFPLARVYDVIDGANVPAHGTREMPVWGRDYKIKAGEYYADAPYDPDAFVRARILALVEYINRLQAK